MARPLDADRARIRSSVPDAPDGGTGTSAGAIDEWRRHWRSVVAVSIGIATGYAAYQFSASQFIAPWQEAFGWSRGQIALAHNGLLISALLLPFAGRLLDRFGVRRPLLIAMVLTGLSFLAMATLNGSLAQYYAIFLVLQVVGMMTTGVSFTRVIVMRFEASRGLALASSRIGMALVGMAVPAIVHGIIMAHDWRAGFFFLAGVTLLIGLPVCWFGIHDGAGPQQPNGRRSARQSFVRLVRENRGIVLLCLAGGLNYAPLGAVLSQLQPLLVSKGIVPADAALMGGLYAGAVLIGTMLSGVLVDRVWAPLVGCLFAIGPMIGCAVLLQASPDLWMVGVAVVLIGMAQGAEIDVIAYITARYFDLGRYSSIYGLVMMATVIVTFSAQIAIGYAFDHFGNYQIALITAMALLGGAIAAYLALGRYPAPIPQPITATNG